MDQHKRVKDQIADWDRESGQAGEKSPAETPRPCEIGGQQGPEPTRYGDWEKNGRCTDF